ncbi:hypothetical protein A5733_05850 [Mycobacterium sp. NS-7484]|uniref:heme-binding protein n=1 Tax=unclassified Mycobacterium TaxID=2642494 RepID=UPI0007FEEDC7|nr:hypothetical protein A5699_19760 [Mycobacterium sp. E802]OMB99743.1 hypothetical protein A5733_05850 [Mycobacterium sp. NS-7484]
MTTPFSLHLPLHRLMVGIAGAAIAGAALVGTAAGAAADPPPDCTSADLARVMSGVSAATSDYLFAHPEVNTFMTGLKGLPKDQIREKIRAYGDENPQVRADLQGIRQPAVEFRDRCG